MFSYTSTVLLSIFARGGGGGHGGGGGGHAGGYGGGGYYTGGSTGSSLSGIIFLLIFLAPVIIFMIYLAKQKRKNMSHSNAVVESNDENWPSGVNGDVISKIFYSFQTDWSNFNIDSMQAYTTKKYLYDVNLMLTALHNMGRQNVMENVQLLTCHPLGVSETQTLAQEPLVVTIRGAAKDSLVDKASGQTFYTDTSEFTEYWYFILEEGSWRLNDIKQVTESENVLHPAIQNFAIQNGYFYSGEWGGLLLPVRGQLFSRANFSDSAVNDHVIGIHNNVIIEFYTYMPNKNYPEAHTVAQAVLPKNYGNIIVHRRSGLLNIKPHGLTQVSMEWPDFNKKYAVYATDMERVTSFELLNPSFMVKLEELPFEVNIEVVDNIVYLHTKQALEDYSPMLTILYLAFKEMRM
jgi:hypothetical protein